MSFALILANIHTTTSDLRNYGATPKRVQAFMQALQAHTVWSLTAWTLAEENEARAAIRTGLDIIIGSPAETLQGAA